METIGFPLIADTILGQIADKYLENYAAIAYLSVVDVLSGHKFIKLPPEGEGA